jgi:hypothetical protein
MSSAVRLPLVEPSEQTKAEITHVVAHLGRYYTDGLVENMGVVSPGGLRLAAG